MLHRRQLDKDRQSRRKSRGHIGSAAQVNCRTATQSERRAFSNNSPASPSNAPPEMEHSRRLKRRPDRRPFEKPGGNNNEVESQRRLPPKDALGARLSSVEAAGSPAKTIPQQAGHAPSELEHSRRLEHRPDRRPSEKPGGNNNEVEPQRRLPPKDALGARLSSADAAGSPAKTIPQQAGDAPSEMEHSRRLEHRPDRRPSEKPGGINNEVEPQRRLPPKDALGARLSSAEAAGSPAKTNPQEAGAGISPELTGEESSCSDHSDNSSDAESLEDNEHGEQPASPGDAPPEMEHSRRLQHQPDRRPLEKPGGNNCEVEFQRRLPPKDALGARLSSAETVGSPAKTNPQQAGAGISPELSGEESSCSDHSDNSSDAESLEDNERGEQPASPGDAPPEMEHSRRLQHQPDRRLLEKPGGNNSEVEPQRQLPPKDALGARLSSAEAAGSPAKTNPQQAGAGISPELSGEESSSSDAESLEDNEHGEQPCLDLDEAINRLSPVTIEISEEDVQRRWEEKERTAVLYFFDRGLSLEQVKYWVDSELTRNRRLNASSITRMGSRNFHIQFSARKDRDRALSRTRISFLRQEFIILKWTLAADDHKFVPEHYPVWVGFPKLTNLQVLWVNEIASTLGPVLPTPGRTEKTNRDIFRVCVEWKHGTPTPSSIPVKLGKKIELIPIDITHLPNSCFRCRRQGHLATKCPGDPLFTTAQNGTGPGARTQTGQERRANKGAKRRTNRRHNGEAVLPLRPRALTCPGARTQTGQKRKANQEATPRTKRRHNGEATQPKATTVQATKPPTTLQIVPQSKISNRTSGPRKEVELLRLSPPGGEPAAIEDAPKTEKQHRERRDPQESPGSQETKLSTPHLQYLPSVRKSSNTEQIEERKSADSLQRGKDASPQSLTFQSQRSNELAEQVEERKSADSLQSWKDASPQSLTFQCQRSNELAEERNTATCPAPLLTCLKAASQKKESSTSDSLNGGAGTKRKSATSTLEPSHKSKLQRGLTLGMEPPAQLTNEDVEPSSLASIIQQSMSESLIYLDMQCTPMHLLLLCTSLHIFRILFNVLP
ncbi:hypothetical protein MARPO_0002s0325 [Marchantia polymorpha]|uniref:CCHC-type domain-containing protein n=1 Tax=Marchantia polymorpha TaxID=3197 RepID=A0A2R6XUY2_MARPO|nr:hypothetical protein MARPO_0002s0325 [Marchantia polymorpha]|eukprot:PTQ49890.1 hypothetical protein MARPO_0002s0325 [Marchantia polymorpha]